MEPMTEPRIPPLARADADKWQAELLDQFEPDQLLNLFATLAHHAKLMRSWLPFGGRLLFGGLLPARDRELVILCTSAKCDAAYEWGHHVPLARSAGLSNDEIAACAKPVSDSTLSGSDHTLRQAVEEIVDHHRLGDETWNVLAEVYDDRQLIEVTILIGHYMMIAGLLNSVGIQNEHPAPAIGAVA